MTNVEIAELLQTGVSVYLTEEGQNKLRGIDHTMNKQTTTKSVDIKQLCQALGITVPQFLNK